jgi:hypothetical protein
MAEYQGKKVTLNFSPCGSGGNKIKRITFGDANLGMHKNNKARKKSYCARSGGIKSDRCSANYWARRDWDC